MLVFLSEWREFPSAPCLARKKNLMTARIFMLKSCASLTCFRACFLLDRAKNLSAPHVSTVLICAVTKIEPPHSVPLIRSYQIQIFLFKNLDF